MKFRWHRGGLNASMQTVVEFDGSAPALVALLMKDAARWLSPINVGDLAVEPYGFDDRIGWDTHIVTVKGEAVGFTDGAIAMPLDETSEQRQ